MNAGWFPDPSGQPGQRYYDGQRRTVHRADASGGLWLDAENASTSQLSCDEPPRRRPRWRGTTLVATTLALVLVGSIIFLGVQLTRCHQATPPPSATAPTNSTPDHQSTTSRTPATTMWSGSWSSRGVQYPATLWLTNTDPIAGIIDIPGICSASWIEAVRNSATSRLVDAHVTSGGCFDNQWNLTVLIPTSIIGTDTTDPGTTVHFTPSAKTVT